MFKQKLWIKGAGDLASGVAARLYRSGFKVMMSELKTPTTVRRSVAFSPAVYLGECEVENIHAVFCENLEEAERCVESDRIAVLVDEDGSVCRRYKPDILIDAIIAKKNTGTAKEDAKIVIALGPGFNAGLDCHALIETKRGHDLGRVIRQGFASENTGIPGNIGGYDKERIVRAVSEGRFLANAKIGDIIKKGDKIAYSGEEAIFAQIGGVLRGLLQDGVYVYPGMKCGDIDPRCDIKNCYTISDKAYAVAGGVLEAVLYFLEREQVFGSERRQENEKR